MSKNAGKKFEEDVKNSIDGFYSYRLKDSGSSFGNKKDSGLRFTISNDYDMLYFLEGNYFAIEEKSCKSTSFSFALSKKETAQIKFSQIEGLEKVCQYYRCHGGFLFNFRHSERKNGKLDKTYWLNVYNFYRFLDDTDKKSINEDDMIKYGAILVQDRKKVSRYLYNIGKLSYDIVERESYIVEKIKFDLDRYEKKLGFKNKK